MNYIEELLSMDDICLDSELSNIPIKEFKEKLKSAVLDIKKSKDTCSCAIPDKTYIGGEGLFCCSCNREI